jgi:glycosyltransferase involved in cell wall biosynthesis
VVHEGVDIVEVCPAQDARFVLPDGRILTPNDEVVTFVARNLEPVRGFTALMRALPDLLRRRPMAQILICGEDGVSYGRPPSDAATWREAMQREVSLDPSRVHFTGRLSRQAYISLLRVSALHLYLSVPFVLSWSCVEALAAGCLILASDVAPVREVIEHGVNGFLVDARDPDALASEAADLLARRAAFVSGRQRAREQAARRFDLRQCLARQTRIIRSLIE